MDRARRSWGIGVLAACVASGCPATRRDVPRPNVLLVTLDTTRADHLGAYGAAGATTPVFDRIAAQGTLFERAWSATPLTTPSHASVMTGLYPQAHGVRNNGRFRLPDGSRTLAEAFAAAGYATGAFVGAYPVARTFGFSQGFATFDDDFGDGDRGDGRSERSAAEVNARALPWLASALAGSKPFFAWIHYYDAHLPYEPPSPYAESFAGRPYDGEIAFADAELGRVLDALAKGGALDRTIVVIAGDHGEGLGDHGEASHGLLVYESTLHVPLVVRAPWKVARGERRRDLVSLVDLAPTIAALAHVPFEGSIDGRDVMGREAAPETDDPLAPGPGRTVYAESFFAAEEFGWAPLFAIRRGGMKWIAAPRPERYDLDADPGEARDLARTDPAKDDAMNALLSRVAVASSSHASKEGAETGVDDDLLARLQSLGYVGGGGAGAPAASGSGPGRDPKDGVADYDEYLRGTDVIRDGGDAVSIFERLVAGDPENPEFRLRLGQAHRARGDLRAAEATYRELIRRYPDFYLAYRRLTALLASQGRHAECRDLWLALRGHGGTYVGIDARLAESYLGTGENALALATAEAGLSAAGGSDAELSVLAGRALERLGRDDEALGRYRNALSARPSHTEALDGAIALLRRLNRTAEIQPLVQDCVARSAGNPAVRQRLAGS
ncbi:MAG TPA: sulfatase-like hydrolase/transferase [Candidatus Polarisedimenticolaceae bacterium]|nr:sulfatase-like hydrolase/transferase [Candidatus Polarisedimenticolaceae bacterium]